MARLKPYRHVVKEFDWLDWFFALFILLVIFGSLLWTFYL